MTYAEMRRIAKTGDVVLVEGRGLVSVLIRVLTGSSFSHIGMLLWLNGGLWVAEMKEFRGYRLIPASLWIKDTANVGNRIYYGKAPSEVIQAPERVLQAAFSYRNASYGYLSLVKVWAAQVLRRWIRVRELVCSTFVQRCWTAAGYAFDQTADPGDYLRHACFTAPIEVNNG